MKPFNLEEALAGKQVVTRHGKKIVEIHHFKKISSYNYCVVVGVEIEPNEFDCYATTVEGKAGIIGDHKLDLFMADEEPKELCIICNEREKGVVSSLCENCLNTPMLKDYIFLLAKRIKALEDKLK